MHHRHSRMANCNNFTGGRGYVFVYVVNGCDRYCEVGYPWMLVVHAYKLLDISPPSWISLNASCAFLIAFYDFLMPPMDFSGEFRLDLSLLIVVAKVCNRPIINLVLSSNLYLPSKSLVQNFTKEYVKENRLLNLSNKYNSPSAMHFISQIRKDNKLNKSSGDGVNKSSFALNQIGQEELRGRGTENDGSRLPLMKMAAFSRLGRMKDSSRQDLNSPSRGNCIRHQIDRLKSLDKLETHKKLGKENKRPAISDPTLSKEDIQQILRAGNEERYTNRKPGESQFLKSSSNVLNKSMINTLKTENLSLADKMFPMISQAHIEATPALKANISNGNMKVSNSTGKVSESVNRINDLNPSNERLLKSSSRDDFGQVSRTNTETKVPQPPTVNYLNKQGVSKMHPKQRPKIYSLFNLKHLNFGKQNSVKPKNNSKSKLDNFDDSLHILVNYSTNAFPPDPVLLDLLRLTLKLNRTACEITSGKYNDTRENIERHFSPINKTTNENSVSRKDNAATNLGRHLDSAAINLRQHFPLKMRLYSQAHPHPHQHQHPHPYPNQLDHIPPHRHLHRDGYRPETAERQPFKEPQKEQFLQPFHQLDSQMCTNFTPHHFELTSSNRENGTVSENFRLVNDAFPVIIKMQNYTTDNDLLMRQDENSNFSDENENTYSVPLSVIIDSLPQAQLLQKAIFYNNSLSTDASTPEIMKKTVEHWNAMIDNLQTVSSMFNGNFSNPCNIVCNTVNCSMIPCLRALQIMPQVYAYLFENNESAEKNSSKTGNFRNSNILRSKDQYSEEGSFVKNTERNFKALPRATTPQTERILDSRTHENSHIGDKFEVRTDKKQDLTIAPLEEQVVKMIDKSTQTLPFKTFVPRVNQLMAGFHKNAYHPVQNESMILPPFIQPEISDLGKYTTGPIDRPKMYSIFSPTQSYEWTQVQASQELQEQDSFGEAIPVTDRNLDLQRMILPVDFFGFPHNYDSKTAHEKVQNALASNAETVKIIAQDPEKHIATDANVPAQGMMTQNAVLFSNEMQSMSPPALKYENEPLDDNYYQLDDEVYPDLMDEAPTFSTLNFQSPSQFWLPHENFDALNRNSIFPESTLMSLNDRHEMASQATDRVTDICNCEQSGPLQKPMKSQSNLLPVTMKDWMRYTPKIQQHDEQDFIKLTSRDWKHLHEKIASIDWSDHTKNSEKTEDRMPLNDYVSAFTTQSLNLPIFVPGYFHPKSNSQVSDYANRQMDQPTFSTINTHNKPQTAIGSMFEKKGSKVGENQHRPAKKQRVKVDDDVSELVLWMPQTLPKMTFLFRQVNMKPVLSSTNSSYSKDSDKTVKGFDKPFIHKNMFDLRSEDTEQNFGEKNASEISDKQSTAPHNLKSWNSFDDRNSFDDIKMDSDRDTAPFMSFKNEVMGLSSYASHDFLSSGDLDDDTVALPNNERYNLNEHSASHGRSKAQRSSNHRSRLNAKYRHRHRTNGPANKIDHKSIQGNYTPRQSLAHASQSSQYSLQIVESTTTGASNYKSFGQNNPTNFKTMTIYHHPNSQLKMSENTALHNNHQAKTLSSKYRHSRYEGLSRNYSRSSRHHLHHSQQQIQDRGESAMNYRKKQQKYSPRMRGFIKYFKHSDAPISQVKNAQFEIRPKSDYQPIKNRTGLEGIDNSQQRNFSPSSKLNLPTIDGERNEPERQTVRNEYFTRKKGRTSDTTSDKDSHTEQTLQTLNALSSTIKFPANTTFLFDEDDIFQRDLQESRIRNAAKSSDARSQIDQSTNMNLHRWADGKACDKKVSQEAIIRDSRDRNLEDTNNNSMPDAIKFFTLKTTQTVQPVHYINIDVKTGAINRANTGESITSTQSDLHFGEKLEDEEQANVQEDTDETTPTYKDELVSETKPSTSYILDASIYREGNFQSTEESSTIETQSSLKLNDKKSGENFTEGTDGDQKHYSRSTDKNLVTVNYPTGATVLTKQFQANHGNMIVESTLIDGSEKFHMANATLTSNVKDFHPDSAIPETGQQKSELRPTLVQVKEVQDTGKTQKQIVPLEQKAALELTTETGYKKERVQAHQNIPGTSKLILIKGQHYNPHTLNALRVITILPQNGRASLEQTKRNPLIITPKDYNKPLQNLNEPSVTQLFVNTAQSMNEQIVEENENTTILSLNTSPLTTTPRTDETGSSITFMPLLIQNKNKVIAKTGYSNLDHIDGRNTYIGVRDKRVKSKGGLFRKKKVYAQIHSAVPFNVDDARVYHAIKVPSSVITPYLTLSTGPLQRNKTNNSLINALRDSMHRKSDNNVCILVKNREQLMAKIGPEKKKLGRIEQLVHMPNFISRKNSPTQIEKWMKNPEDAKLRGQKTAENTSQQLNEKERKEITGVPKDRSPLDPPKNKEKNFNSKLYLIPFQKLTNYNLFKATPQDRAVVTEKNFETVVPEKIHHTPSDSSTMQDTKSPGEQTQELGQSRFPGRNQELQTENSSDQDIHNQTQPQDLLLNQGPSLNLDHGQEQQFSFNESIINLTATDGQQKNQGTNGQIVKQMLLNDVAESGQQFWGQQISQIGESASLTTSAAINGQTLPDLNNGITYFSSPRFKYYYITIKPELMPRLSQYIQFIKFATPAVLHSQTTVLTNTEVPVTNSPLQTSEKGYTIDSDKNMASTYNQTDSKIPKSTNLNVFQYSNSVSIPIVANYNSSVSEFRDNLLPSLDKMTINDALAAGNTSDAIDPVKTSVNYEVTVESVRLSTDEPVTNTDNRAGITAYQLMVTTMNSVEKTVDQNTTAEKMNQSTTESMRKDKNAVTEIKSTAETKEDKGSVNMLHEESNNKETKNEGVENKTSNYDGVGTKTANQNLMVKFDGTTVEVRKVKAEAVKFSSKETESKTGTSVKEECSQRSSSLKETDRHFSVESISLHETTPKSDLDETSAKTTSSITNKSLSVHSKMNSNLISQRNKHNDTSISRGEKLSENKLTGGKVNFTTLSENVNVLTFKTSKDKHAQLQNSSQFNQVIKIPGSTEKIADKIDTTTHNFSRHLIPSELTSTRTDPSNRNSNCTTSRTARETDIPSTDRLANAKYPVISAQNLQKAKISKTPMTVKSFQLTETTGKFNKSSNEQANVMIAKESDNSSQNTNSEKNSGEQTKNESQTSKDTTWAGKSMKIELITSTPLNRNEALASEKTSAKKGTEGEERKDIHAKFYVKTANMTSGIAKNNSLMPTMESKETQEVIPRFNKNKFTEKAKFENKTAKLIEEPKLQKETESCLLKKQVKTADADSVIQNTTRLFFNVTSAPKLLLSTAKIKQETDTIQFATHQISKTGNYSTGSKSALTSDNKQNEPEKTQTFLKTQTVVDQITPCATIKCSTVKICNNVTKSRQAIGQTVVPSSGLYSETPAKILRANDGWMTSANETTGTQTTIGCAKTQCVIFQKDSATERMSVCLDEKNKLNFLTTLADKLNNKISDAQAVLRNKIFGTSSQTRGNEYSPATMTTPATIPENSSYRITEEKMTISTPTDTDNLEKLSSRLISTSNTTTTHSDYNKLANKCVSVQILDRDANTNKINQASQEKMSNLSKPNQTTSRAQQTLVNVLHQSSITENGKVIAHPTVTPSVNSPLKTNYTTPSDGQQRKL